MSVTAQEGQLFQPLKDDSIRLLSIRPGYLADRIECIVVSVDNLDEAPPYEALSYVWGTEDGRETIVCNGVQKKVTDNLYEALKHLRPLPSWNYQNAWDENHPLHSKRNVWRGFAKHRYEEYGKLASTETLVWIDALCINQDDPHEQASQVKLMRSIYKQATIVRIWLGPEDTHHVSEPEIKSWSRRLAARVTPRHHLGNYGDMPVVLSFIAQALRNVNGAANPLVALKSADDSDFRNRAYGLPVPSAPEWRILRQFFSHPWFKRVWVVQEVVVASCAVAILGNWEIEWSALGEAAAWYQSKGFELPLSLEFTPPELNDLVPVSNAATTWRMSFAPDKCIPLLELLRDSRRRLAKRDVDKLYATLGLAKEIQSAEGDKFDALIEPDYLKSVAEVFRDAAKYLIIDHGNLNVLSHAGGGRQADHDANWPSWVPKWSEGKASMEYADTKLSDVHRVDAGEPLTIGIPHHVNSLPLYGIKVDTIQSHGQRLTSYGFGPQVHQEERDFVMAAWTIFARQTAQQDGPYTSPIAKARAFTLTMTAGLSNTSRPAEADLNYTQDAACWFSKHLKNRLPIVSWMQQLGWNFFPNKPDPGRFHEAFVRACTGRRFFVTKGGSIGMGPQGLKEGDWVVALFGGQVPYVIRGSEGGFYQFIGDSYVPGLMEGQAVDRWKKEGTNPELIELL